MHVPVPKASHTTIEKLHDFLATTFEHQINTLDSVSKSDYSFVDRPTVLSSPPPAGKRRKRSLESPPKYEPLSPPPADKAVIKQQTATTQKSSTIPPPIEPKSAPLAAQQAQHSTTTKNDPIDKIFGPKPKDGEKSRGQTFLENVGLKSPPRYEPSSPPITETAHVPIPQQPVSKSLSEKDNNNKKDQIKSEKTAVSLPSVSDNKPGDKITSSKAINIEKENAQKNLKDIRLPDPPPAEPISPPPATQAPQLPTTKSPISKTLSPEKEKERNLVPSPKHSDPIDAIFGQRPKDNEKNRGEKFLEDVGLREPPPSIPPSSPPPVSPPPPQQSTSDVSADLPSTKHTDPIDMLFGANKPETSKDDNDIITNIFGRK